jgi:hypothetical protein
LSQYKAQPLFANYFVNVHFTHTAFFFKTSKLNQMIIKKAKIIVNLKNKLTGSYDDFVSYTTPQVLSSLLQRVRQVAPHYDHVSYHRLHDGVRQLRVSEDKDEERDYQDEI